MPAAEVRWHAEYRGTAETRAHEIGARPGQVTAVTADKDGNVYVAGSSAALDLPLRNASQNVIRSNSLIRTDDGGRTWKPLPIPSAALSAPAVHPKTPSTVLVSGLYGVYRSDDAGETWQTALDLGVPGNRARFGYLEAVQYDASDARRAWIGSTAGVLRTTDGGSTWSLVASGLEPGICCLGGPLAVDRIRPGRLMYANSTGLYFSDDAGDNWRRLLRVTEQTPYSITADPFVPDRFYISVYRAVFVSSDSGRNWYPVRREKGTIHALEPDFTTAGAMLGIDVDDSFIQSTDYGQTWTPVETTLPFTQIGLDPAIPNRWKASIRSTTTSRSDRYLSDDRGKTWRSLGLPRELYLTSDPSVPSRIYGAGDSAVDVWLAKYSPAGELVFATMFGGQGEDRAWAIAVDRASGNIAVAGSTTSSDLHVGTTTTGEPNSNTNAFVALFDPAGRPLHALSVASGTDVVTGLAFGPDGSIHAAWFARSLNLPVFPGSLAIETEYAQLYYVHLSKSADMVVHSSYLGSVTALYDQQIRVAVDQSGFPVITGGFAHSEFTGVPSSLWPPTSTGGANVLRLSSSGQLVLAANVPASVAAVAVDAEGDIYLAGQATAVQSSPTPAGAWQREMTTDCPHSSGTSVSSRFYDRYMTDAWFARVDSRITAHKGGTLFGGACVERVSDIGVSDDGLVTIVGIGYSVPLPSTDDVTALPASGLPAAYAAQFDAGGTTLLASGYVQGATQARGTTASSGFAVVTTDFGYQAVPTAWSIRFSDKPLPLRIQAIRPAFLAASTATAPGSIVVVSVAGLPVDGNKYPGLNPAEGAPYAFDGVSVTFNGIAAPLLGLRGGEITAVIPVAIPAPGVAEVVVHSPDGTTGRLYLSLAAQAPVFYPDIRNADGSLNTPENPESPGKPLTLFLTGVPPSPSARDGVLASENAAPSNWTGSVFVVETGQHFELVAPRPVPGFVYGLYYVTMPAPSGPCACTLSATGLKVHVR